MSNLRILIRFIRATGTPNTDDRVVITRLDQNRFSLGYTYGDTKNKNPHTIALDDKAVFRWMRTTIGMLEKDADPFSMIQMDTPFMPSVLFSTKTLDNAYNTMLDALEFHLDNWPVPPVLEDYEEEEENYSEMPSYVNMTNSRRHLFLDEWES